MYLASQAYDGFAAIFHDSRPQCRLCPTGTAAVRGPGPGPRVAVHRLPVHSPRPSGQAFLHNE